MTKELSKNEKLEIMMTNFSDFNVNLISAKNIYNALVRNDGSRGRMSIDTIGNCIKDYLYNIESTFTRKIISKGFYALDDIIYWYPLSTPYSSRYDIKKDLDLFTTVSTLRVICDQYRMGYTQNHYVQNPNDPALNLALVLYKVFIEKDLAQYSDVLKQCLVVLEEIFNNQKKG